MFSFSLIEILIVIGISVSIFTWQLTKMPEKTDSEPTKFCSPSIEATHRRADEEHWFLERGEFVCVNYSS